MKLFSLFAVASKACDLSSIVTLTTCSAEKMEFSFADKNTDQVDDADCLALLDSTDYKGYIGLQEGHTESGCDVFSGVGPNDKSFDVYTAGTGCYETTATESQISIRTMFYVATLANNIRTMETIEFTCNIETEFTTNPLDLTLADEPVEKEINSTISTVNLKAVKPGEATETTNFDLGEKAMIICDISASSTLFKISYESCTFHGIDIISGGTKSLDLVSVAPQSNALPDATYSSFAPAGVYATFELQMFGKIDAGVDENKLLCTMKLALL